MRTRSALALVALVPFVASALAQTTNLGLASASPPPQVAAHGDLVAFAASELRRGADLDGDGAIDDHVPHVHGVSTRITTNTGISLPQTAARI